MNTNLLILILFAFVCFCYKCLSSNQENFYETANFPLDVFDTPERRDRHERPDRHDRHDRPDRHDRHYRQN